MKVHIFAFSLFICLTCQARDISFRAGLFYLTWDQSSRSLNIRNPKNLGETSYLIFHSKPQAAYENAEGKRRSVFTSDCYNQVVYTTQQFADEFGPGTAHILTFTQPDKFQADQVTMRLTFYAHPHLPFLLAQLSLISLAGSIRSNHLEPISTSQAWQLLPNSTSNRILQVPFDNDDFGRYHTLPMTTSATSYEVGAIFNGNSRQGYVFGSIDHDHWKSGICISAIDNGRVSSLRLISGISDRFTRDDLPSYGHLAHGSLQGDTVRSARFFIGCFADWRVGMETFADACATVRPPLTNWEGGTPFGWQSWGVMADKNSFEADIEISDYYAQVLMPGGFTNAQGNIIISLDASDGHNETQKQQFIAHATSNGQMVGCYSTPFSLWWDEQSINTYTISWEENGENRKGIMRDAVLKIHGKPIKYDGAYCADPTHPVTQKSIIDFVRSQASKGIKYIKADFLSCGIIQADSYYNPEIHTAVEAYNQGMKVLSNECRSHGIFLALSIAPLFPHGYANSRRIACDTWGNINHSEYCMNAISGGWWTDRLYQYNDPDHIVLIGNNDQLHNTLGENRARFTSAAVSGMMLVADNFSPADRSGHGDNNLSRKRAEQVMLNADINRMADRGQSFRPLYGHHEFGGEHHQSQSLFVRHDSIYTYLAAFNFTSSDTLFTIPISDLDITHPRRITDVKELWLSQNMPLRGGRIDVFVPAKDARVVRIKTKKVRHLSK